MAPHISELSTTSATVAHVVVAKSRINDRRLSRMSPIDLQPPRIDRSTYFKTLPFTNSPYAGESYVYGQVGCDS
jgi:hypothetical protein